MAPIRTVKTYHHRVYQAPSSLIICDGEKLPPTRLHPYMRILKVPAPPPTDVGTELSDFFDMICQIGSSPITSPPSFGYFCVFNPNRPIHTTYSYPLPPVPFIFYASFSSGEPNQRHIAAPTHDAMDEDDIYDPWFDESLIPMA